MVNEHEKYINQINMKLKDLNIFELFKSDNEENEQNNEKNNLFDKLENISSKIKLNSEKISKVEESNYKMSRDILNIKNSQEMMRRNILSNKQSIEEIQSKIDEQEKKLENVPNKENKPTIPNPENQPPDNNLISNITVKEALQKKRETSKEDLSSLFNEKLNDSNKDIDKKLKEIHKKINELDKLCKNFSTMENYYELKSDIKDIKKNSNKYATNFDLNSVYNKSEENEKEIRFIKAKCEDLENSLDTRDEFKILKKKVEFFNNRIENLENNERKIKNKIDNEISTKNNISENLKNLLEIKTFENFKTQITKEFTSINSNFIHTRKILDEMTDSMKEKVSYSDLKILEKSFDAKLENIQLYSIKRFAEKADTLKSFKYIEQQIKSIFELMQKRTGENEGWLIAKKPLNLNLCASCESYLGDLKDNNPYVPWNKYPLRDTNDKIYRLGNGYSKMLQMLNIDENEKKNLSSLGLGMNFKDNLDNKTKKEKIAQNEINDSCGDANNTNNTNNNFNKTMGNFMKNPQKNLPLIKKKFLMKNKSELTNIDEFKTGRNNNK
jgi:predicted  nucleic acid-binding Zn-ribbon protein